MNIQQKRQRARFKISRTPAQYRISVNKTNAYFSAQVIEQKTGNIVASISQKQYEKDGKSKAKPVELVGLMGEELGKTLKEKKITSSIAYDRSGYIYHGKVKAFADGLRKAGLTF